MSGTNIPTECKLNIGVPCNECKSCMSGTNIPTECISTPEFVACKDCPEGSSLATCKPPKLVNCLVCPEWNTLPECMEDKETIETTESLTGLIINLLMIVLSGINSIFIGKYKTYNIIFGVSSFILGGIILLGVNLDISILSLLSGNSFPTITGGILGGSYVLNSLLTFLSLTF
jgi:hypothetical protein